MSNFQSEIIPHKLPGNKPQPDGQPDRLSPTSTLASVQANSPVHVCTRNRVFLDFCL